MDGMLSQTRGKGYRWLCLAAIKDAPSSLPLLTGSDTALIDRLDVVSHVVILPSRGPIVSMQLLCIAVLLDAAIWRTPGVTTHTLPGITTP